MGCVTVKQKQKEGTLSNSKFPIANQDLQNQISKTRQLDEQTISKIISKQKPIQQKQDQFPSLQGKDFSTFRSIPKKRQDKQTKPQKNTEEYKIETNLKKQEQKVENNHENASICDRVQQNKNDMDFQFPELDEKIESRIKIQVGAKQNENIKQKSLRNQDTIKNLENDQTKIPKSKQFPVSTQFQFVNAVEANQYSYNRQFDQFNHNQTNGYKLNNQKNI